METTPAAYNVYYEPAIDAIVMEWKGYATSRQFREGTELMLESLVMNKTFKALASIKDMAIIASEDQEWLHNEFLPRAAEKGFRVLAIVRPDSYFNKVAVESISYRADKNKLAITFFDNEEDAREWLSLLPNPYKKDLK